MDVNVMYPPQPRGRGRVIALHCSGAGASQWNYLAEALVGGYEVARSRVLQKRKHGAVDR